MGVSVQSLAKEFTQWEDTEKALRVVIDGFAYLVGLAWEQAFDKADEVIVEEVSWMRRHPVFFQSLISFAVALLLIPAWMKYIVPMAAQPIEFWIERVKQQQVTEPMLCTCPCCRRRQDRNVVRQNNFAIESNNQDADL